MNTLRFVPTSVALVLSLALLGGCVSTPAPSEQMVVAETAVQHANTSSTSENAAPELQIAMAKLASAKLAEEKKAYLLANQLADEAVVDAQVAELHAQSERSRKAAEESQDAALALSKEMNR